MGFTKDFGIQVIVFSIKPLPGVPCFERKYYLEPSELEPREVARRCSSK